MNTPEGNSKPVGLSRDQWSAFKRRWLKGESVTSLANHYQITQVSIYKMIKRQGWARTLCPTKGIGDSGGVAKSAKTTGNASLEAISDQLDDDNSLISSDLTPQAFQEALSRRLKSLIAKGIDLIEPPRNPSELKTFYDIIRKADGLDNQTLAGASAPLMGGLRTISRRSGPVIDVPADPLEGFEV